MNVDYPGAVGMFVDEQRVFIDALSVCQNSDLSIVIHKTACNAVCSAQSVAQFFASDPAEASTHFIVGLDGTVVQCVSLKDGAAGNCCVEQGYDSYWDPYLTKYGNLNRCTISIEHVDQTADNSQAPTINQLHASFQLVGWLCQKYGIPSDRIKTHASIDPINRAHCPGNYPINVLIASVEVRKNHFMEQQELDIWNMFLAGISQPLVSYTTGIAASWKLNYTHMNAGSPLGPEKKTVDWGGNSIQVQYFSSGVRCEWNNTSGGAAWYDCYNKRIA